MVKSLRDAGAVIIAKTGMTELANWVAGPRGCRRLQPAWWLRHESLRSAPRSSRPELRRPSGAAAGRLELRHRHGRELLGGERRHRDVGLAPQPCQSDHAGGIKPTVGRISRYGIIPITADQDTAGPDGADGCRCGRPARGAGGCGAGPERSGDKACAAGRPATTRDFSIRAGLRARASAFRAPSIDGSLHRGAAARLNAEQRRR